MEVTLFCHARVLVAYIMCHDEWRNMLPAKIRLVSSRTCFSSICCVTTNDKAQYQLKHCLRIMSCKVARFVHGTESAWLVYEPKVLWTQIYINPSFYEPKFLWTRVYMNPSFYEPEFMNPSFYEPKFIWTQILWTWVYEPKFLWTQVYMNPSFYKPECMNQCYQIPA